MKNGIIYNGPSLLDGKPIVAIATYSDRNTKTGKVLQTYIIRSDISPLDANKTGEDFSICGNLGQGPTIVYKSYRRGVYPVADNKADRIDLGFGRVVRIGTYGDPAAVPSNVWDQLLTGCETHLAYSHQSGFRPDIAMQSADTREQAIEHWNSGRRTFRVIQDLKELIKGKEILCPASKEAGRRVQCNACKLCGGTSIKSSKSIAIVEH
jgi:hypothetical protein